MASEEMEGIHADSRTATRRANTCCCSIRSTARRNIDVNVSIGTIFSVLRCPRATQRRRASRTSCSRARKQVAAGYCVYGPQTMLVLTVGNGVAMLHARSRAWAPSCSRSANMRIPEDTKEFAINMSNQRHWDAPVQRYIDECLAGKEGPRGKDFNMRWVASMVADVHRILTRGGIFMYPLGQARAGQAGQAAPDVRGQPDGAARRAGRRRRHQRPQRILDIQPKKLHQRVPVFLGSKNEVERVTAYHQQ